MSLLKTLKKFILLNIMAVLTSCGTLTVRSSPPEASVGIILSDQEKPKILGATPLTTDISDLSEAVNSGTVIVVVEKRGYISQQFIVPNLTGGSLQIDANLKPNLPSNYQGINRIVTLTLRAERRIIEKRLDEAMTTATEIKKINENIAAAYEIEGTVHFLKRDLKNSRFAWIRSLELEPNNPEGQKILAAIEKTLGVKNSMEDDAQPTQPKKD